jgi:hypothetical protein
MTGRARVGTIIHITVTATTAALGTNVQVCIEIRISIIFTGLVRAQLQHLRISLLHYAMCNRCGTVWKYFRTASNSRETTRYLCTGRSSTLLTLMMYMFIESSPHLPNAVAR